LKLKIFKTPKKGVWKLDVVLKSPKEAKEYAKEANYIAKHGIGLGKPKYRWEYKAVGNKVYVRYMGKIKTTSSRRKHRKSTKKRSHRRRRR